MEDFNNDRFVVSGPTCSSNLIKENKKCRQNFSTKNAIPKISVFTAIFAAFALIAILPNMAFSQTIPLVTKCSDETSPIFLLQRNITNTTQLSVVPAINFLECSEYCSSASNVRANRIIKTDLTNKLLNIQENNTNNNNNNKGSSGGGGGGGDSGSSKNSSSLFTKEFLSNIINELITANSSDCELWPNLDSKIQLDLQECVAIDYENGQCRILGAILNNDGSTNPNDNNVTKERGHSRLAQKSCVKSERICASPFHFDVHEQKILVGFAREVVPAESIQVCLSACLNAFDTFGFECESVMYYPIDSECILNTEDRLDRPDLFVDEHEDTVIYLDNNCAGSQCYAPYLTQYVAVENRQLREELDHSYSDVDQASCEELCTQRLTTTVNDFNCKSFMYNNETRTCILSDERSKPLGRSNLTTANGVNYYEKKCFASPRTCRNVPSFTRVPQMLLVGFAAFVMENVPSVTMCLDQCTNPPPETGEKFVCKSAMYYYNEQECILNAESRQSKPDLFIPEEDDFVVDYFDINCRLEAEKCPDGSTLQTIKTLNAALPEGDGSIHVIETAGNNVADCMTKCISSAPEKCRSFNYDKASNICNLMYLDGKNSLRPQVKEGIDLYDLHCLKEPLSSVSCLNKGGALYSRFLYTKQIGLPSKQLKTVALSKCLNVCSTSERCEGVNYNRRNGNCDIFEQVEMANGNAGEKDDHIDFYSNLCVVKEIDTGVSSAINVPKQVFKPASNITINRPSITSPPKKTDLGFREFESRRKPVEVKTETVTETVTETATEKATETVTETAKTDSIVESNLDKSANQIVTPGAKLTVEKAEINNNNAISPVLIPANAVHTICNYEGIKVQIKNNEPFNGVVFVKNKYDTCRVEVEKSDSATLVLGLPHNFGMKPILLNGDPSSSSSSNTKLKASSKIEVGDAEKVNNEAQIPSTATTAGGDHGVSANEIRRRRQSERDCGLQDMDNGTYKTTIVVQTNNLGIPGLVTSMDQIYEISCNYSSMLGGKITTAANMTVHGPQPSLINPKGKIELGNPVLMQMNAGNGAGAGQPVIQAKLGDILELRWEIMAMDEELDFLVKDCFAEPGSSSAKTDEKLQLIEAGCPTPAVAQKLIPNPIQVQSSAVKIAHLQAFRFDSSATVRITCHLEICKGDCKAASCNLPSGQQDSWGRKKRNSDNEITEYETKRYKVPRYAQATTSLVIIDPLQQINDPVASAGANSNFAKQSAQDFAYKMPKSNKLIEKTAILHGPWPTHGKSSANEMCMNKWTLMGIFGTLFALIFVQALIVTKYMFKRMLTNKLATKKLDSVNDAVDTMKSFHY